MVVRAARSLLESTGSSARTNSTSRTRISSDSPASLTAEPGATRLDSPVTCCRAQRAAAQHASSLLWVIRSPRKPHRSTQETTALTSRNEWRHRWAINGAGIQRRSVEIEHVAEGVAELAAKVLGASNPGPSSPLENPGHDLSETGHGEFDPGAAVGQRGGLLSAVPGAGLGFGSRGSG